MCSWQISILRALIAAMFDTIRDYCFYNWKILRFLLSEKLRFSVFCVLEYFVHAGRLMHKDIQHMKKVVNFWSSQTILRNLYRWAKPNLWVTISIVPFPFEPSLVIVSFICLLNLPMIYFLICRYPVQETIQKYLWPRLCTLDQKTLYITFTFFWKKRITFVIL
mgnify:CR=1 FL=1